jgi:hypothetical protein
MARAFREWLIERLLGTEFVRAPMTDGQIDETAIYLGVQPDVLVEARVRSKIERASLGVPEALGQKRRGSRHMQYSLWMPLEIHKAWKEECEFRGVEGSALLRALINDYLVKSREPERVLSHWVWRGRMHTVPRAGAGRQRECALLPGGAYRALKRRAARRGASLLALVRSLALEAMEGKHHAVPLVDARMMFDDEDRYYLGAP